MCSISQTVYVAFVSCSMPFFFQNMFQPKRRLVPNCFPCL
uniref:Uncharacterized protein n=1 Tax=Arundo donax TaxID=35708 RepID=A0A0A9HMH2_ARUDO